MSRAIIILNLHKVHCFVTQYTRYLCSTVGLGTTLTAPSTNGEVFLGARVSLMSNYLVPHRDFDRGSPRPES